MSNKPKFDLTVHRKNPKGKIYQVDPYRLYIENGQQRFERPPGSGNFFYADGSEIPKVGQPVKQAEKPNEKKA